MSSVVISGDTSGSITVAAPAVAGSNTITLPAVTGTAVIAGQNSAITASTAQASTSGTSITFSSIPSWVKRITVMLNGVSTNGSSIPQIQIGSGSVSTSGYTTNAGYAVNSAASSVNNATSGFILTGSSSAASVFYGIATLCLLGSNTWVFSFSGTQGSNTFLGGGGVSPALSGALDRVVLTTVNGTDTFDAGSINILYE